MNYLKVEGHSNLYRDPHTKAIISVGDDSKRTNYITQRKVLEQTSDINIEIDTIKKDINSLKNSMDMIIELLQRKE